MTDIKKIKPNGEYKSGLYEPQNPSKYIGDVHNIIFRSSWEYRFCVYCDTNESILKWSSEAITIPYYNPLDKKEHNYNVDFYINVQQESGKSAEWLIEVKPERQHLNKPVLEGVITLHKLKSYNRNMQIWITNQAKFKAAKDWAEKRGFRFGVVDENFLFRDR
jgi:hypothetical protein